MIILGLILVLAAVAAAILLVEGTSQLTDGVDIDVLGGTISLPPLALLITGAAVISIFWLGWALMRSGIKRSSRRRREAKEAAERAEQDRLANEQRMQDQFAQRERQLADERRRAQEENEALRRESDQRLQEQRLSTEEARRRAEVAESEASRTADPRGIADPRHGDARDPRNVADPRPAGEHRGDGTPGDPRR